MSCFVLKPHQVQIQDLCKGGGASEILPDPHLLTFAFVVLRVISYCFIADVIEELPFCWIRCYILITIQQVLQLPVNVIRKQRQFWQLNCLSNMKIKIFKTLNNSERKRICESTNPWKLLLYVLHWNKLASPMENGNLDYWSLLASSWFIFCPI